MTAMTNFLENALQDHLFRGRSYAAPATHYIALFTAAPSDAGGGTEVSGGSYARIGITANDTNWNNTQGNTTGASTGSGGTIDNAVEFAFPTPSADWGTVVSWGIFDAVTGGNLLLQSALTTNRVITNGQIAPVFPIGSLTNQIDN